jgi:hypothetical protein
LCRRRAATHALAKACAEGNPMAAINLRCIDGIDLAALPVQEFNGRDT